MAVPSRPLAVVIFRFLLVGLLTVVLLVGTALVIAAAYAYVCDEPWSEPEYLAIGFACGFIVWFFVVIFHLRRETQTMSFSQKEQFVAKAKSVLSEMGYALVYHRANRLSFRPRFHAYLFGGAIHIELAEQDARLTGPKVTLDVFRRSFRMLNHVQRVQMYLQDHRKITDNVLKRVELRLRLQPDQLAAVRKNVIEPLENDGAVICELNLMVNSEEGIREDLVEFQLRQWLCEHGISVEIHKGLVQFVEVVHPELEPETTAY
jgi:hypothetical protein